MVYLDIIQKCFQVEKKGARRVCQSKNWRKWLINKLIECLVFHWSIWNRDEHLYSTNYNWCSSLKETWQNSVWGEPSFGWKESSLCADQSIPAHYQHLLEQYFASRQAKDGYIGCLCRHHVPLDFYPSQQNYCNERIQAEVRLQVRRKRHQARKQEKNIQS